METQVWTDGSYSHRTNKGGWAWVSHDQWDSGHSENGHSSGAMELRAILHALRAFQPETPLVIYTDHLDFARKLKVERHILHAWLAGHLRDRTNLTHGLMVLVFDELEGRQVRFEHIKGHAGDKYNERADRLAKNARLSA